MPATPHIHPRTLTLRRLIVLMIAALIASAGTVIAAAPAHAASQGSGFGTWAPVSPYGWHGSMLVGGVHTYCILPGAPAPTGESVDHGLSTDAAGLSAQQLTGINLLVTKYGQSGDPVQAAAVGWAVKAIANWDDTLHHFGYRGDSLAEAIHWTLSALAPQHSASVQQLAVAYFDEARSVQAGVARATGSVVFTTDAADPARGSVRVEATTTSATGTLTLTDAVFAGSGTPTISDAVPGVEYAIITAPPAPGRPYQVSAAGRFTVTGPVAAVRHFSTAGGQDTAGPAGEMTFEVVGADAAPRVPQFAPTITTQVASKYVGGGAFIDDVVFRGSVQDWPRTADGEYLPVTATAEVFRTDSPPAVTDGAVPDDAVHIGSLGLTSDGVHGPAGPYRVASLWNLTEPGFYTAVWTVRHEDQTQEVGAHLPAGYAWTEPFGEPSQVTLVADVSSLAQPSVRAGDTMSDKIIVSGPIPAGGLTVTSSVYLGADGIAPSESCTEEAQVWTSDSHTVSEAGEVIVTSPAVDDPGTYYWQERAVDAAGELVHLGACGVPHETTIVEVASSPSPRVTLAATGGLPLHAGVIAAVALLTAGAVIRRAQRFGASRRSG